MTTYIELFDKGSIENICACLVNVPDRVIFVGNSVKQVNRYAKYYKEIFANRGRELTVEYKPANKNNLSTLVQALCDIIDNSAEDDQIFIDLTGGADLALVAAGIVVGRHEKRRKLKLHKFNIRSNSILDCDMDGFVLQGENLALSVEENVKIHGGSVVYDDMRAGTTYKWDMNDDFILDIAKLWNMCKGNVRLWNAQTGVFGIAETLKKFSEDPLTTKVSKTGLETYLEQKKYKFVLNNYLLTSLIKQQFISYEDDGDILTIKYKNLQVKKCLTKAGQILELKVYSTLQSMANNRSDESQYDIMNGVFLDWDGEVHTGFSSVSDTENEIDIIAMKGIIPVFISCKNGNVSIDELYKLDVVARRFGGEYAKRVLVATALDDTKPGTQALRQRANDMNIRIIDDFTTATNAHLESELATIWQ